MPVPWDLLESLKSGESTPINEIVEYELPVLIPAAFGILVALVVLIVTPLFCCCRCCGNCGSRLLMSDVRKQQRCCLYVTSTFVLFSISLISLTAFSSYESGVRFRKSPRTILEMVDSSLDDLPAFITNFGSEISLLVETELNETLKDMKVRVKDLPNILSAPLTDIAGSAMTGVNSHIQNLQNGIANITSLETETNATVEDIRRHSHNLGNRISEINNNLTLIKNQCVIAGETFCHLLLDPTTNTADFNITELSDLSSAITDLVSELNSVNLTEIQNLGNESLSKLPEVIDNSSKTAVAAVLEALDEIPGTVMPELDKVLEFTNMSRSSLGLDSSIDSFRSLVDSYDAVTTPLVDKTVLPLVSIYLSFIVLIALLGLLLGLSCSRIGTVTSSTVTSTRSKPSNIGSTCLICTVTLCVLPVFIFMLISPLLLVVGSNLSIACDPIQDLTLIRKLEDGYLDLFSVESLSDTLNVNISIFHFFETCKNKGTVFSGLHLGERFNLSSYINVSSFVPELGSDVYDSINETIRDMNVLDVALIDNMTSSFTFANITSDNSTHLIKEELRDLNLVEWSTNLTTVVQQLPNGANKTYADAYSSLVEHLINFNVNEKVPLLLAMETIDNITVKLVDLADKLQNSSESIASELENLQQFIQNQATDSIFTTIHDFLDDMAQVPVDFIDAVTHKMSDDFGQCQVLWDIYEGITSSFCGYLLDSMTVFWFSLYIGGLAMVALMISSCKIGKYFRKTDKIRGQRSHYNMSCNALSTNAHSSVEMSDNPIERQRALPNWCYRVVKKKQHKRRGHFLTGSQSPQLINIRLLRESLRNTTAIGNENAYRDFNNSNVSVNELSPLIETNFSNVNEMTEYSSVMCTPKMNHINQSSKTEEFDTNGQSPLLHFYRDHLTEAFDYSKVNEGFNSPAEDVKILYNKYGSKATELQCVDNVDRRDKDSSVVNSNDRDSGHVVQTKRKECEMLSISEVNKLKVLENRRKMPNENKGSKEGKNKMCMDSSKSSTQDRTKSIDGLSSFVEPKKTKLLVEKSCDKHILQSQACRAISRDLGTNIQRINNLNLHHANDLHGVKIQCALCKSRNLTESGGVFGLSSDNGQVALNGYIFRESAHTRDEEDDVSEVHREYLTDTNIHVDTYERTTSETNLKSQDQLLSRCTDCNNLHGVYEEAKPEHSARSNAKSGPLNEALCEFNVVYESLASPHEVIIRHDRSNKAVNDVRSKQFNREVPTTSNKNSLCIQVKPYKDIYADKDYMATKTDNPLPKPMACAHKGRGITVNDGEYPSEVNGKTKSNIPVVSLSMLAEDAHRQAYNRSRLSSEFRHMSASRGHAHEKTTYL